MSEHFYQEAKTRDYRLVESEIESQHASPVESTAAACAESQNAPPVESPAVLEAEPAARGERFAQPAEDIVLPRRDLASYALSHNFGSAASYGNTETIGAWRMFWELRGRQCFNTLYFLVGSYACFAVGSSSEFLQGPTTAVAFFFAFLAMGAAVYFILRRSPADSDEVFSPRSQKNIRRFALAAPLVAIVFAIWNNLGWAVAGWGANGNLPGQPQPQERDQYLANARNVRDLAANISPLNTVLLKHLSDQAFTMQAYDQSLALKDRLIVLAPWVDHLRISRLLSLVRLPERQSEFEATVAQYKSAYAADGYLWNVLADAAVYKKDWPTALEMANKHVQIHDREIVAFEQRAGILKELGQTVEADADLAKVESFRNGFFPGNK